MRHLHLETNLIHSFGKEEKSILNGAVVCPIHLSTTFRENSDFEYGRAGNPTRQVLENRIAVTHGVSHGFCFSSGMAAISAISFILRSVNRSKILCIADIYSGTRRFLTPFPGKGCISPFSQVEYITREQFEDTEFLNKKTMEFDAVWIESPTNPSLHILDIAQISQIAKKNDCLVCVDNTLASVSIQNPFEFGADLVIYSATKYMNGHSDVIMGLVLTDSAELASHLKYIQICQGSIPSPFDCYMVLRGLKTLEIRMQRHSQNALVLAKYFQKSPHIKKVIYPGLETHPQHELAKTCFAKNSFGGMITFYTNYGEQKTLKFLDHLKIISVAESLGAVESLIEHPKTMTHVSLPKEAKQKLHITESMIRFSVGIENVNDLVEDIHQAFSHI